MFSNPSEGIFIGHLQINVQCMRQSSYKDISETKMDKGDGNSVIWTHDTGIKCLHIQMCTKCV